MKIPDVNLANYDNFLNAAPNRVLPNTLVLAIIEHLREAQELIEKCHPQYRTNDNTTYWCVYCNQPVEQPCETDCPYAIRERLGYGQKETKDG